MGRFDKLARFFVALVRWPARKRLRLGDESVAGSA